MTRYYDVAVVGKLFKLDGALFMVLPFDWEKDTYFNMCICSKNPIFEVGCEYEFFYEEVVEVDEKVLEKLNSLLDD